MPIPDDPDTGFVYASGSGFLCESERCLLRCGDDPSGCPADFTPVEFFDYLSAALLLLPLPAAAWNAEGHMAITAIAYEQLLPTPKESPFQARAPGSRTALPDRGRSATLVGPRKGGYTRDDETRTQRALPLRERA